MLVPGVVPLAIQALQLLVALAPLAVPVQVDDEIEIVDRRVLAVDEDVALGSARLVNEAGNLRPA